MKGDSRVDPRDLHIPLVLLAAAPNEVAFVCGRAGASQAINEEEDDDGPQLNELHYDTCLILLHDDDDEVEVRYAREG